jgi:hypothetical protein
MKAVLSLQMVPLVTCIRVLTHHVCRNRGPSSKTTIAIWKEANMQRANCCLLIAAICFSLSACNTTKATIDTTVKFFSSTSPDSMFTADGMVEQRQKVNLFAGVAYENLRQEAAAGGGQYMTSLATLYQVPAENHRAFGQLLHASTANSSRRV